MIPSVRIKHESLFCRVANRPVPRNVRLGRYQFWRHQSLGIAPRGGGTLYYRLLAYGKWLADWTTEQYRKVYLTWEWWGWDAIRRDFADDPDGYRFYFSWCPGRPEL